MVCHICVGGGPSLELVTPLPVYFLRFQNLTIAIAAHVVNSFGKTVRASQSNLDVFLVQNGDGIGLEIANYAPDTGRLDISLPMDISNNFSSPGRYIEIFLDSATNITISPVFAGMYIVNTDMFIAYSMLG